MISNYWRMRQVCKCDIVTTTLHSGNLLQLENSSSECITQHLQILEYFYLLFYIGKNQLVGPKSGVHNVEPDSP